MCQLQACSAVCLQSSQLRVASRAAAVLCAVCHERSRTSAECLERSVRSAVQCCVRVMFACVSVARMLYSRARACCVHGEQRASCVSSVQVHANACCVASCAWQLAVQHHVHAAGSCSGSNACVRRIMCATSVQRSACAASVVCNRSCCGNAAVCCVCGAASCAASNAGTVHPSGVERAAVSVHLPACVAQQRAKRCASRAVPCVCSAAAVCASAAAEANAVSQWWCSSCRASSSSCAAV